MSQDIEDTFRCASAVRDHFPQEILQAQRERRALQRDEQPEDLVGPVFFLASDDAGVP